MRRREFVALTVVQQRRGHLQQLELRCDIICLSSGDAACSSSPIMRPLSSKMTFYYKRVSPVIFFGIVLLMFGFGLISVLRDRQVSNVPFLIVLLLLAVFASVYEKVSVQSCRRGDRIGDQFDPYRKSSNVADAALGAELELRCDTICLSSSDAA